MVWLATFLGHGLLGGDEHMVGSGERDLDRVWHKCSGFFSDRTEKHGATQATCPCDSHLRFSSTPTPSIGRSNAVAAAAGPADVSLKTPVP
jgi:hypothetical protein